MKRREHIMITQEDMHHLLGLGDDVEIVQMTALPECFTINVHLQGETLKRVPARCESYNIGFEVVDWV